MYNKFLKIVLAIAAILTFNSISAEAQGRGNNHKNYKHSYHHQSNKHKYAKRHAAEHKYYKKHHRHAPPHWAPAYGHRRKAYHHRYYRPQPRGAVIVIPLPVPRF